MNAYSLIRPILFHLDPETAHGLTLRALAVYGHLPAFTGRRTHDAPDAAHQVMGINFPNRVGLAAGLDKDAEAVDGLARLGFGFIEIGTLTPLAQPGNARPRLFRLSEHKAIINRMGFNNRGIDAAIDRLRRVKYRGILGINIGKNALTPMTDAANDYLTCLRKAYPLATYVTVNISSPNTKNLRQLQEGETLDGLLASLKQEQTRLADTHGRYVPLVLKIAPDLDPTQITAIADVLKRHNIDGVIATNTTLSRQGVESSGLAGEVGGLSGAPLKDRATAVVSLLARALANELPIIAAGGILCGDDAAEKIAAGATLVQLYSGLIYQGPDLVTQCRQATAPSH